jgi:hypothetical protein
MQPDQCRVPSTVLSRLEVAVYWRCRTEWRRREGLRARRREALKSSGDDNGLELYRNVNGKVGQQMTGMLTDTETKTKPKLAFWPPNVAYTASKPVPSCPPTQRCRRNKSPPLAVSNRVDNIKRASFGAASASGGGQCLTDTFKMEG